MTSALRSGRLERLLLLYPPDARDRKVLFALIRTRAMAQQRGLDGEFVKLARDHGLVLPKEMPMTPEEDKRFISQRMQEVDRLKLYRSLLAFQASVDVTAHLYLNMLMKRAQETEPTPLENVEVAGDSAAGRVGGSEIRFVRIGGRWYLEPGSEDRPAGWGGGSREARDSRERGRESAETAARDETRRAEKHWALDPARSAFARSDYPEAVRHFGSLLDQYPNHRESRVGLVYACRWLLRYPAAERHLRAASQLETQPSASLLVGQGLLHREWAAEHDRSAGRLVRLRATYQASEPGVAKACAEIATHCRARAASLRKSARAAWRQVLQHHPTALPAAVQQARVHALAGRLDAAVAALERHLDREGPAAFDDSAGIRQTGTPPRSTRPDAPRRTPEDPAARERRIATLVQRLGKHLQSVEPKNSLVRIGAPAVPALAKALVHPDSSMRRDAAEALAKIGRPALAALLAATKRPPLVARLAAVEALGRERWNYVDQMSPAREIVPALLELLRGDEPAELRGQAISALGSLGPGASRAGPVLVALLALGKTNDRWSALWALGKSGGLDDSLVHRLKGLTADRRSSMRAAAISTLATAPSSHSLPWMIQALRDPASEVRSAAAHALRGFNMQPDLVVGGLVAALRDAKPDVREGAAGSLAWLGPRARQAVPDLARTLSDENLDVATRAAHALGRIGIPIRDVLKALIRALGSKKYRVRSAVERALRHLAEATSHPGVRHQVEQALREHRRTR